MRVKNNQHKALFSSHNKKDGIYTHSFQPSVFCLKAEPRARENDCLDRNYCVRKHAAEGRPFGVNSLAFINLNLILFALHLSPNYKAWRFHGRGINMCGKDQRTNWASLREFTLPLLILFLLKTRCSYFRISCFIPIETTHMQYFSKQSSRLSGLRLATSFFLRADEATWKK